MECHHIVTSGPIVLTIRQEALMEMNTAIAHKIIVCPAYLKPYQNFKIRLSRFKCYEQNDILSCANSQRSPLSRSILITAEDGTD